MVAGGWAGDDAGGEVMMLMVQLVFDGRPLPNVRCTCYEYTLFLLRVVIMISWQ